MVMVMVMAMAVVMPVVMAMVMAMAAIISRMHVIHLRAIYTKTLFTNITYNIKT